MTHAVDGVPMRPPELIVEPPKRPVPEPNEANAPSTFGTLFRGVLGRIEEGERVTQGSTAHPASLDAASLIALQAGIYRYSEAVDLAAKLVDRVATGVRTVLQAGH